MTILLPHSGVLVFFIFTFNGTIFKLCNTKTTCDCTFVTFDGSIFLFSQMMILLSHQAVPTSYLTVIFFFLTFDGAILTLYNTNIKCDCTFVTFGGSLFFSSHLMVKVSHQAVAYIKLDRTFLTFDGFIFFFSPITILPLKPKK